MALCLRESLLGTAYYRLLKNRLLPHLQNRGLKPNQITLLGTVLAGLAPVGFFMHPLAGSVLIIASGVADSLDGLMARQQYQTSVFGAFLDSTLDRLSDFFYLGGFWVLFWGHPRFLFASALIFGAMLLTLLVSYIKARAESLGAYCNVGLMERGARVVYLIIWGISIAFIPQTRTILLWLGLGAYCGLTLLTVIQRILHVHRQVTTIAQAKPRS